MKKAITYASFSISAMLFFAGVLNAQEDDWQSTMILVDSEMGLSDLAGKFNQRATGHKIGSTQAPLTEDEIVAAIRLEMVKHKIPAKQLGKFKTLIEKRIIDTTKRDQRGVGYGRDGTVIYFTSEYKLNGYHFTGWNISLLYNGITIPVRSTHVSSRPLTAEEKKKIADRIRRISH